MYFTAAVLHITFANTLCQWKCKIWSKKQFRKRYFWHNLEYSLHMWSNSFIYCMFRKQIGPKKVTCSHLKTIMQLYVLTLMSVQTSFDNVMWRCQIWCQTALILSQFL